MYHVIVLCNRPRLKPGLLVLELSGCSSNQGGFLPSAGLSPLGNEYRPRASSNASSCGRLSPIPSVFGGENDWGSQDYPPPAGADQLAGNLADAMNLQGSDPYLNSWVLMAFTIKCKKGCLRIIQNHFENFVWFDG